MRNRFKDLDLIDRVPDELRNEVRDIVQETGFKTIPMEKKCKKSKTAVWGGLTNSCEKKRSKKQRKKGKIQASECAEFQRIAKRDKKAFLSDQCKKIEENNRMGKIRDLFKKIRDTKGLFHEKMGSIKNRNSMNLREAEVFKKRWQEYTEELYKKDLHNPDNHHGVITHLEPEILECEVKWGLRKHHYEQS